MKNYLIFGALIIILLAVFLMGGGGQPVIYSSERYGVSFSYPSGYVIQERDVNPSHHSITLIREADAEPRENSEGPPAITLDIFENASTSTPLVSWLENSPESNFALIRGTYSSTTLSGEDAVSYSWSGLYEGDSVATLYGARVFNFSVTYLAPGDRIRRDFGDLLKAVELR